jgi:hypothetical protein
MVTRTLLSVTFIRTLPVLFVDAKRKGKNPRCWIPPTSVILSSLLSAVSAVKCWGTVGDRHLRSLKYRVIQKLDNISRVIDKVTTEPTGCDIHGRSCRVARVYTAQCVHCSVATNYCFYINWTSRTVRANSSVFARIQIHTSRAVESESEGILGAVGVGVGKDVPTPTPTSI